MTDNPLGKETYYPVAFDPDLLVALPRSSNRNLLGLSELLPFVGEDVWQAYEISWLDKKGLPKVAVGRFIFPCESPFLIESKSFKLFLNSLNQESFQDKQAVITLLTEFIKGTCLNAEVKVVLFELEESADLIKSPGGLCLDNMDVQIDHYQPNSALLTINKKFKRQLKSACYSNLFKSNCPVTNQPDWGSMSIHYKGPHFNHERGF